MALDFNTYGVKGNEFLSYLEDNLRSTDRPHAARILRSTFRVLRNHLSFEESFQLLSQLPMAIKAVYVDGWKIAEHKKIKTVDDFVNEIIREDGNNAWRDFGSKAEIIDCVRAVMDTMRMYVSKEEISQAINTLPDNVKTIFK
ncbi:MAG TPA: DUF2267 domain-containing protein [Cyclobacteriaceae bacterium]|nr:DUF2267 domain-containing protein [Cyclobacteriaceae bacterium]